MLIINDFFINANSSIDQPSRSNDEILDKNNEEFIFYHNVFKIFFLYIRYNSDKNVYEDQQ